MARRTAPLIADPALGRFAAKLQQQIAAERVLRFGSHARGDARTDSDYDLIVVSLAFDNIVPPRRAIGLRQLWYVVGGDAPLDLICVTPQEFEAAQHRNLLIAAVLPEAVDLLPR